MEEDAGDTLYSVKDIAEMYKVTVWTVRRWQQKGLKSVRCNTYMFKKRWVDEFLDEESDREQVKKQLPICQVLKSPKFKRVPKFNENMKINLEDILEG